MTGEEVVKRKRADPERDFDEVRGLQTITFNGSETDDEVTITVDNVGVGAWDDSESDPRIHVGQPIVRTAGSPASNSDRVISVKVHTIAVDSSGILTFKIKVWIHTAVGGSTAANLVYIDLPYTITGDLSDY